MKKSIPNENTPRDILNLKSRGELKAVEFKVARLSSKLARLLKEYRELTECKGVPAESVEACYLEMQIQRDTKKLAELIAGSGGI
ncbi:hypothetical protein [Robertkochia flava]|uniref:hypothetical protein n=1 Tax=Robertkochia flava TaxID=3447986 RepID=UPI001CCCEACD|nr:hypothetical protein [Robertkochia marina]